MTTEQIAHRLVELCREGKFEMAQDELFAPDAISIEPNESEAFAKETKGLEAIIQKGHEFAAMVEEMHGGSVSEPLLSGHSFAVVMTMDMTMKGKGRMNMSELCVYETEEGKIISESFHM